MSDIDDDFEYNSDEEAHMTDEESDNESEKNEDNIDVVENEIEEEHDEKTPDTFTLTAKNTYPFITYFEFVRLIQARANELEGNAPQHVPIIVGETPSQTALRELNSSVLPMGVMRMMPGRREKKDEKSALKINPNEINPDTRERWYTPGMYPISEKI